MVRKRKKMRKNRVLLDRKASMDPKIEMLPDGKWGLFVNGDLRCLAYKREILEEMVKDEWGVRGNGGEE